MKKLKVVSFFLLGMAVFLDTAMAQIVTEIETNKTTYAQGEVIEVKLTLRNTGTEKVTITAGPSPAFFEFDEFKAVEHAVVLPMMANHEFAPGDFRTWTWVLDPDETGLPYFSGTHTIKGRVVDFITSEVFEASTEIEAETTLKGQVLVQYFATTPADTINAIKSELNAVVADSSYHAGDEAYYEAWGISGWSILDVLEKYKSHSGFQAFDYDHRVLLYESFETNVNTEQPDDVSTLAGELYPNPFADQATLKITLDKAQHINVQLFDVLGREVKGLYNGMASGQKAIEVDGSELAPGIYFYRVITEKEVLEGRVVRNP